MSDLLPIRKGELDASTVALLKRVAGALVDIVDDEVTVDQMVVVQSLLLGETIAQADADERPQLRAVARANIDMVAGGNS